MIIVSSATVLAKQTTETINVIYDNIKILIDGVEYTANKNTAEFSVYDTYSLKFKLNWKFNELATQMLTYKDYTNFICDLKGIGNNEQDVM